MRAVPVFARNAGDAEGSFISYRQSLIITNNYGYDGPAPVSDGHTTARGMERVDIDRNGRGCHKAGTARR